MTTTFLRFGTDSALDARIDAPEAAKAIIVLGHGSGSNMGVPVMEGITAALRKAGFAVMRFHYPYSQDPGFVPYTDMPTDSPEVLLATYRAALALAGKAMPDLPLIAAGHSMSAFALAHLGAQDLRHAVAQVFLGYPSKGDAEREDLLVEAALPSLVVQGTRDEYGLRESLSRLEGLSPVLQFAWIEGAGHLYERDDGDFAAAYDEVAGEISCFVEGVLA